jgi:prolyl oligopeptidase
VTLVLEVSERGAYEYAKNRVVRHRRGDYYARGEVRQAAGDSGLFHDPKNMRAPSVNVVRALSKRLLRPASERRRCQQADVLDAKGRSQFSIIHQRLICVDSLGWRMLSSPRIRSVMRTLWCGAVMGSFVTIASCRSPHADVTTSFGQPLTERPPVARSVAQHDTYFGTTLDDPYRWMETDTQGRDQYLHAQNAFTMSVLRRLPGRDALVARVRELSKGTTVTNAGQRAGPYRFFLRTDPDAELAKLIVADESGHERVLVDPATIVVDSGHTSVDNFAPSFDGHLVAVNLARGGGEITRILVYETATGDQLTDTIERTWGEFPASWLPDGRRFFYTQLPEHPGVDQFQGERVYLHVLGRPVSEDVLILGSGTSASFPLAPTELPSVAVQPGTDWMIAVGGGARDTIHVAIAPLSQLHGTATPWRQIVTYDDAVQDVHILGHDLVLQTTHAAPNHQLVRVPLTTPDLARAQTIVAEDPNASLERFVVAKDAVYAVDLVEGRGRLRRLSGGAATIDTLRLPYEGWVSDFAADPLQDGVFVALESWTRPIRVFRYSVKSGFVDVGGSVSAADYKDIEARELTVKADDGELIPLTVLEKHGVVSDGSHPTIVEAYGGYGVAYTPRFDPLKQAWVERGGIYAICHARGGGEKGLRWHLAGQGVNKPRGVKDVQTCGQYLVAEGLTRTSKLAEKGVSAGGIIAGRVITEQPSVFGTVLVEVGLLNMLRYLEGQNGANQTAELMAVPNSAQGVRTLLAMDGYHNIKAGVKYPAVLFTVGLNDNRVVPWHTSKMAARLEAVSAQVGGKPVLVRVDDDAGHGFGSTRDQAALKSADQWAFVLWQAGDPAFQPK